MKRKRAHFKESGSKYSNGSVYGWIGQQIPLIIGWPRKIYDTDSGYHSENNKGFSMLVESVTYNSEREAVVGGVILTGELKVGDMLHLPFDIKKHKVIDITLLPNNNGICIKLKPSLETRINVGDIVIV